MTKYDEVMISLGLTPSGSPKPIKHGTYYGYKRCHERLQGSCERCRAAKAKYSRENRAANGGRHTTPCRCKRGVAA
jgi:hypothetical protein